MIYEMLPGRVAFPAPTEYARLAAVPTATPDSLAKVDPQLAPLSPVVERAMQKDPAQRFASAIEMARALPNLSGWRRPPRRSPAGPNRTAESPPRRSIGLRAPRAGSPPARRVSGRTRPGRVHAAPRLQPLRRSTFRPRAARSPRPRVHVPHRRRALDVGSCTGRAGAAPGAEPRGPPGPAEIRSTLDARYLEVFPSFFARRRRRGARRDRRGLCVRAREAVRRRRSQLHLQVARPDPGRHRRPRLPRRRVRPSRRGGARDRSGRRREDRRAGASRERRG